MKSYETAITSRGNAEIGQALVVEFNEVPEVQRVGHMSSLLSPTPPQRWSRTSGKLCAGETRSACSDKNEAQDAGAIQDVETS